MYIERGNCGEKSEILIKRLLFDKRDDSAFLVDIFGEDASEGIIVINSDTSSPYSFSHEIKKTKALSKADIIIKFNKNQCIRNCSIKSLIGAKPSIINHTPRSAKIFQPGQLLHSHLTNIDMLAREYINKRSNKEIGEDVKFCNLESFSNPEIKNSFVKLLLYFVFSGTGSKPSPTECDSILIIKDELRFIDCDTEEKKEEYILSILSNCIISFRSKGMPKQVKEECLPWIYTNDKKCGSIHVRMSV